MPAEYAEDRMVMVRATDIRRWKSRLKLVAGERVVFTEVLVGVAMLAFGGALGALSSGVALGSLAGEFFFVLLPVIGTATIIVYVTLRSGEVKSAKSITGEIKRDLDKLVPTEEQSEEK